MRNQYELLKTLVEFTNECENIEFVINVNYGGFVLSKEAYDELEIEWDGYGMKYANSGRADPKLLNVIKQLGEKASNFSEFEIVEIPTKMIFSAFLKNYDGKESLTVNAEDFNTPLWEMI